MTEDGVVIEVSVAQVHGLIAMLEKDPLRAAPHCQHNVPHMLGPRMRHRNAIAQACRVQAVARQQFLVEPVKIQHIRMAHECPCHFVERSRALRALHTEDDPGGIQKA